MCKRLVATAISVPLLAAAPVLAAPMYQIFSLGTAQPADTSGTGTGVSPDGSIATGFSSATGVNRPFTWTQAGGNVALAPMTSPARAFSQPQAINNAGVAVGIGSTTAFGSGPLPIIWSGGTAAQLPLPGGETLGRARSINNSGLIVGSVNGGSLEAAATFTTSSSGAITQTLPNGGRLTTAYGVADNGRIVGQGLDPFNAALTKGWYLDPGDATATDIGALTGLGHNSAIPFGISSDGKYLTGSSSLNSGSGATAFIYDEVNGMTQVPLPAGSTTGQGRGVNSSGWVVGNSSTATSIPFLWDGAQSYRLHDIITVGGAGWDLVGGTSNAAFSISDNGVIVGRGLLNGAITGYAMVPVPEPTAFAMLAFAAPLLRRKR